MITTVMPITCSIGIYGIKRKTQLRMLSSTWTKPSTMPKITEETA